MKLLWIMLMISGAIYFLNEILIEKYGNVELGNGLAGKEVLERIIELDQLENISVKKQMDGKKNKWGKLFRNDEIELKEEVYDGRKVIDYIWVADLMWDHKFYQKNKSLDRCIQLIILVFMFIAFTNIILNCYAFYTKNSLLFQPTHQILTVQIYITIMMNLVFELKKFTWGNAHAKKMCCSQQGILGYQIISISEMTAWLISSVFGCYFLNYIATLF